MPNIPPPPVPPRLREMLKDYPDLIQKVQVELDHVVSKPLQGTPIFEQAVWALEDTLEAMYIDADEAFELAKKGGNAQAIEQTGKKAHLVGCARSDASWNRDGGEQDLWAYFQTYKSTFE